MPNGIRVIRILTAARILSSNRVTRKNSRTPISLRRFRYARLGLPLPGRQDFLETRLEVFLALRPQPEVLDGDRLLNAAHPIEQLANVFSGFFVISLQILRPGH